MKCPNMVHDFSLQQAHLFLPSLKSVSYGISIKHMGHKSRGWKLTDRNTCQNHERKCYGKLCIYFSWMLKMNQRSREIFFPQWHIQILVCQKVKCGLVNWPITICKVTEKKSIFKESSQQQLPHCRGFHNDWLILLRVFVNTW